MQTHSRQLALGLVLGLAVLAHAREGAAYSCIPPRQLSPAPGAVLPSDGLIWDVCYFGAMDGAGVDPRGGCERPVLTDAAGNDVPLVAEREIRSERYARVLTAYRPAEPLEMGARYELEATFFEPRQQEFRVGELPEETPALPVVTAIDFSVHAWSEVGFNARFTFEPFDGSLVVDADGTLSDPLEGLEITANSEQTGAPAFYFAKEPCYVNFADASFGAPAALRFGLVDAAGSFSGWTDPVSIQFPDEETNYPEIDAQIAEANAAPSPVPTRQSSFMNTGCSVSSPASTPTSALTGLALFAVASSFRCRRRGNA